MSFDRPKNFIPFHFNFLLHHLSSCKVHQLRFQVSCTLLNFLLSFSKVIFSPPFLFEDLLLKNRSDHTKLFEVIQMIIVFYLENMVLLPELYSPILQVVIQKFSFVDCWKDPFYDSIIFDPFNYCRR
jgi:hypothetical protein